MVRTQVQLTESQYRTLKEMARRTGLSMAELVRKGVDALLAGDRIVDDEDRRKRAVEILGRYSSGKSDISTKHDEYLAEDYR